MSMAWVPKTEMMPDTNRWNARHDEYRA